MMTSKVEAAVKALKAAAARMDPEELRELAERCEDEACAFRMIATDVEKQERKG